MCRDDAGLATQHWTIEDPMPPPQRDLIMESIVGWAWHCDPAASEETSETGNQRFDWLDPAVVHRLSPVPAGDG